MIDDSTRHVKVEILSREIKNFVICFSHSLCRRIRSIGMIFGTFGVRCEALHASQGPWSPVTPVSNFDANFWHFYVLFGEVWRESRNFVTWNSKFCNLFFPLLMWEDLSDWHVFWQIRGEVWSSICQWGPLVSSYPSFWLRCEFHPLLRSPGDGKRPKWGLVSSDSDDSWCKFIARVWRRFWDN